MLLEEYQKYVFEMEEMGLEPMSLEEFRQEAMSGMATGGRAGYKDGKMVTVPKHWQSAPDHPKTELAYITKAEKDLLVKKDLHNSLEDGPNVGPGGVMSLNGDLADMQAGITGADISAAERGEKPASMSQSRADDFRAGYIAAGGNQGSTKGENKNVKTQVKEIKQDVKTRKKPTLKQKIVTPTQKFLYGIAGNKPVGEKKYINYLVKQGVNVPQKFLDILDYDDDENIPFELDQALRTYNPKVEVGLDDIGNPIYGDEITFADHALKYQGKPGLKFSGNVGNIEVFKKPDGTYDYREKTGDGGGGQQQMAGIQSVAPAAVAPATAATTAATTPAVTSPFAQKNEFPFKDYYVGDSPSAAQLAYGKAMGVDPRMYGLTAYAADGGRIGYAGGGIADLRQGYFLGKLVKKVTRGIKKVAKSPIGKMALIGGLGYLAGGGGMPKFLGGRGVGGFNFRTIFSKKNPLLFTNKELSKGKAFGAISALSSLPLIFGTGDDEREQYGAEGQYRGPSIEDTFGMSLNEIASRARAGTLDPNVFNFLADGGTARQIALKALPEYKTFNEDDEEQKLSLGGSAGLPPVTQETQGMYSQSFGDDETPMPTQPDQMPRPRPMMNPMMGRQMNPIMSMQPRMMAQEGGLMDMGGMEKDYRNEGGFVAIGGQERADDVPARLSKNEFVFTADAVRNAGGGDIDKGAEIMENMMENLEAGGEVSEESQGLEGARAMFATQKRLGEVL
jgi:hypothetical protein